MKPLILGLAAVLALSACQVQKAPDFDYTSFKERNRLQFWWFRR